MGFDFLQGDCREIDPGGLFHALLCDPPYHFTSISERFGKPGAAPAQPGTDGAFQRASRGFMGKEWDGGDVAFQPETWARLAEHLYPGAFGFVFASARGWHRLACAIEDAGLIIHPTIFNWVYGSGFPKATRIDNQIDRAAGAAQTYTGEGKYSSRKPRPYSGGTALNISEHDPRQGHPQYEPATDLAKTWAGYRYGLQALKPAAEPIIVFQVPYQGRPVDNIVETGAGALNIDGARIPTEDALARQNQPGANGWKNSSGGPNNAALYGEPEGRWPSNLVLEEGAAEIIDRQSGKLSGSKPIERPDGHVRFNGSTYAGGNEYRTPAHISPGYGDPGPASKFFFTYQAEQPEGTPPEGRWPSNLVLDEGAAELLDEQAGQKTSGQMRAGTQRSTGGGYNGDFPQTIDRDTYGDSGPASRFFFTYQDEQLAGADPLFYAAKASRAERDGGLYKTKPEKGRHAAYGDFAGTEEHGPNTKGWQRNPHPTVKPLALVRYLATLLLPPAAYGPRRLLVPFSGAGSEVIGAMLAGWEEVIGMEREAEYIAIARARLVYWEERSLAERAQLSLFDLFDTQAQPGAEE